MCLVIEIDQFSYMLLTKRKQTPAILQAWTTKQNGLNKMWPNVFAKCEITHNVLLWIHRVSTIVASVSKTWMLFQTQNFFMSRSRHDHFPRLSRFETETRHWHGETETRPRHSKTCLETETHLETSSSAKPSTNFCQEKLTRPGWRWIFSVSYCATDLLS